MPAYLFFFSICSRRSFLTVVFGFPEEVMLAEENKNAGPSALDGKSAEISVFPRFIVAHFPSALLTLLYIAAAETV